MTILAILPLLIMTACQLGGDRDVVERSPARDPLLRGPQTIEEREPVVVDETGETSPLLQKPDAPPTPVSLTCAKEPCFVIKDWALKSGEVYIRFSESGKIVTVRERGFDNTNLNPEQKSCLADTARALKDYATAHPEGMSGFAALGVSTYFVARVYDTSATTERVSPSLYFLAGGDGQLSKKNLATGKWIIRSGLTKSGDGVQCATPDAKSIAERLAHFKTALAPLAP
jgi:hypothetical protein